jgi:hypothetical protein
MSCGGGYCEELYILPAKFLVILNMLWLENNVMLCPLLALSVKWERSAGNLVRFQDVISVIRSQETALIFLFIRFHQFRNICCMSLRSFYS